MKVARALCQYDLTGRSDMCLETQPMRDPSAPIVGTHEELLAPTMMHRLDLVQCHCAERVVEVAIYVGRAARIPVSSQIRYVTEKRSASLGATLCQVCRPATDTLKACHSLRIWEPTSTGTKRGKAYQSC